MYKFQVAAWRSGVSVTAWRILVFLFLFTGSALVGRAQIYPVQLSTQVSPPYSVYLPDYAGPGGEKLRLVVLQRDLTLQGYRLRFEMKVQVNGVTIMQTSRSAIPPPVMLQPGIPTVLGGSDLSWYVQPQNLEFGGGYSSSTYEQSRSLPEGPVTITFTAYDYTRSDVQVSQASSSFFYATRDNPPLLNYPACGMQVTPINPQFLNFSWLPQNTSSPNSALQTNYIFSLWQVLPAGYNFQDIVQNTRPLYSVTTQQPTLVYGPGEPALAPGQMYAWRVQAVDATGRDIFRNNGYSETCNFIYGGEGAQGAVSFPAIQLKAASAGTAQGKLWWATAEGLNASGYDSYRVYYRKAQGSYDWFSVDVNDSIYRVFDLEPSTTYECRLQGRKGGSYGPYTDVVNFATYAPKAIGCSDNASILGAYSGRPLAVATGGMNITYGPWDVRLLSVQPLGAPGQFRGTCKVTVPFMGGMTFNAKFDNLTIDDSRNVTAGNIVFLSQGMKSWIDSSINNQMGGSLYGKVVSGTDTTNVTVRVSLANLDHLDVADSSNGDIISFALPGNPPVIVPVNDGMQEVTIKDATGSTYALDNKGNLTQLSLADGSLQNFFADPQNVAGLNSLSTDKGVVLFRDADSKYGFDSWKPFYAQASTILTGQYEKLSDGYYVSQKAIGAGESDIVGVSLRLAPGMTADSVVFATGKGERLIWDTTDSTLNLLGGPASDAQEVYALYPKSGGGYYSLGKLLVSSYEHRDFTAVLVPVVGGDGAVPSVNAAETADSLNSIYNKVNISWTVVADSAYTDTDWDADGDGKLTITGSSWLSNKLTGEPAALISNYRAQRPVDKTRQYLFVLNTSSGSTGDPGNVAGDMPRATQYGFVFLDQSGEGAQTAVVVAHELGHGRFNLEHSFSGDIALGGQGATAEYPNLMDNLGDNYRHLYKYQWNQAHQPGQVIGVFEGDAAGETLAQPYLRCIHDDNVIVKLGKTFYDPAGNVIQLADDMTPYAFFGNKEGSLYGNLAAFKKGGRTYVYLLYASGAQEGEYGNVFGTIDGTGQIIAPTIIHGVAQSVKIDASNKWNAVVLSDCKCDDLASIIKPSGQVKIGDKVTGKVKQSSGSGTAADASADILLCADDPFNEKHQLLVQYADGTSTWGQTIVQQLNAAVNGNKLNHFGDDPMLAKLNGVSYVLTGADYKDNDIFQGGYTLEELNDKMAYLEISKGYQFYTRFIQTGCTFTQQVADAFAQKVLDSSDVSKTNGIVCLVLFNENAPAGDPHQFTIGMAFGSGVAESSAIRSALNATAGDVRKSIVGSLINAYQLIPKKRIVYSYFIGKITSADIAARQQIIDNGGTYETALKDTIWYKIDNLDNSPGNVIDAEYYIADTVNGKIVSQIFDGQKSLKEQYVSIEGLNVSVNYAVNYAGWVIQKDSLPEVSACHFTLGKPCLQVAIDDAFFVATLITPQRYALIPISAAIMYYAATGQPDEVGQYLIMYGLGEFLGPAIEYAKIKSPELLKFGPKKLRDFAVALKFSQVVSEGISEMAAKTLFEKELGSACAEYIIPDKDVKNYWIKTLGTADGRVTSVMVGTIEGQNLVVKGYSEGTNYIIVSVDQVQLAKIVQDAINAEGLVDAALLMKEEKFPSAVKNIATLQAASKLTNVANATLLELQAINRYTINGDILNTPMRGTSVTDLSPVNFDPTEQALYNQMRNALAELRKTSRLYTDHVFRGRSFSLADYNALFKGVNTDVPLKGFQSATTDEGVAVEFMNLTRKAPTDVSVVMKIRPAAGVEIDDLSAYGSNLAKSADQQIQREVLMEEGYFRQVGKPELKTAPDGTPYFEIELVELAKPIR